MKAGDLILSTTWGIELCLPINNLLFLSFQIFHVVANQITCKIAPRAFTLPPSKENWLKWSTTSRGRVVEKPSHLNKHCQTEPNVEQCKNKWVLVLTELQPAIHNRESKGITPRQRRLSFVGSLSRNRRHANSTTLRGTCLFQRVVTDKCSKVTHFMC